MTADGLDVRVARWVDAAAPHVVRSRPTATAETTSGRVLGVRRRRALRFAGIPYAAPPVGERRFRPPAPPVPWVGVRDARLAGSLAPQAGRVRRFPFGAARTGEDEDCLTLEVSTPGTSGRRPVMVWLHPGGFQAGSGSLTSYDGGALAAAGDVVVVSVSYRLGPLGWLHLDHRGGDLAGSTNLGLLDQVAALAWVRDNIEAFGGDPRRVTAFGASAGGLSIASLLASPRAAGLIHRAAIQSAPLAHVLGVDEAAEVADRVLDEAGCRTLGDLQGVPVERLLAAQAQVNLATALRAGPAGQVRSTFLLGPVVDGTTLPRSPLEAAAEGRLDPVPMIVGTNRDEWDVLRWYAGEQGGEDELRSWLAGVTGDRAEVVRAVYHRTEGGDASRVRAAVMTDLLFTRPTDRFVEGLLAGHSEPVHRYLFTWSRDRAIGAAHGVEQPYIFDRVRPWQQGGGAVLIGLRPPRALVRSLQGAWTAFAATGRPDHPALPPWPTAAGGRTMVFDDPPHVEVEPLAERLAALGEG